MTAAHTSSRGETECCDSRDLVSFSTVCPASRMMLGGIECSGSICFHYEEMNIMLTKCVAVKRGPGLLCNVYLMFRFV